MLARWITSPVVAGAVVLLVSLLSCCPRMKGYDTVVYITFVSLKPFLCVVVNSYKLGFILYSPLCDAQQLTVCFCCKSL